MAFISRLVLLCIAALSVTVAQDDGRGCDANCTLADSTNAFLRCGKVVSTHPQYGDKCVYLTKVR